MLQIFEIVSLVDTPGTTDLLTPLVDEPLAGLPWIPSSLEGPFHGIPRDRSSDGPIVIALS